MITAKVIEDSISPDDARITTLQLRYQRFIHAELMTHRAFSRCASSSRATPVAKLLNQVRLDPAMPIHWGANRPGMQAPEQLPQILVNSCKEKWIEAANAAADIAEVMALGIGLHKQVANRILEPFTFINVIVTSTEWANFFELRDHPDAQPEMRALALEMARAKNQSTPVFRHRERDSEAAWHLPYIYPEEARGVSLAAFLPRPRVGRALRSRVVLEPRRHGARPSEGSAALREARRRKTAPRKPARAPGLPAGGAELQVAQLHRLAPIPRGDRRLSFPFKSSASKQK
jgi:hypothetical protein